MDKSNLAFVKKEEEIIIVVLLGLNDWRVGDQGLGDGVVGVETDGRVELVRDQLLRSPADVHSLHSLTARRLKFEIFVLKSRLKQTSLFYGHVQLKLCN